MHTQQTWPNTHKKTENPQEVEEFRHVDIEQCSSEDLYYILAMFPYPSGTGIHVGHVLNYTATDILARYKRARGKKVIFPMWFDSFWLPTEDYAKKVWRPAHEVTEENIHNFTEQLQQLNLSYDWSREIKTSSPDFYKWTQRLFIQLYKAGYAYKEKAYVYRDPIAETVLAKNQVIDWKAERSEAKVELRKVEQWFIKTTHFAEALIAWLDTVDIPEDTKKRQLDLIGKKEGFSVKTTTNKWVPLDIFVQDLSSIDNIRAVVLPPEYFSEEIQKNPLRSPKVQEYQTTALAKTVLERKQTRKPTYIHTGQTINLPWTNYTVPVILSDYIDGDEPLWVRVLFDPWIVEIERQDKALFDALQVDKIINQNTSLSTKVDQQVLLDTQIATPKTVYNLRDRNIWRERFRWGPIPMLYTEDGEIIPVDENDLPVLLPHSDDPSKNPLLDEKFLETIINGKPMRREPNTFDTFVCSSWYYLRFLDPKNPDALINKKISTKISQVDFYVGGNEHATGHLVYARMMHKFLHELWIVDTEEPFKKVFHQWMIHWADWRKMSKRYNNGVQPSDLLKEYSVDEVRVGIMFMWPLDQQKNWNIAWFTWVRRFFFNINSVVSTNANNPSSEAINSKTSELIKKCTENYELLKYNVIVSDLMQFMHEVKKNPNDFSKKDIEAFLILLHPLAPETAQKNWKSLWNNTFVEIQPRPTKETYPSVESNEISTTPFKIMVKWKHKKTIQLPIDITAQDDVISFMKKHDSWSSLWIDDLNKVVLLKPWQLISFV